MKSGIKKLLVLTLATTTLAACGSGQTAETRMIKQVTDGVEAQSNEIRIRNLLIVKNELSEGVLVGTLVNWSDEVDAINPMDPEIGIDWGFPISDLILSERDLVAQSFSKRMGSAPIPKTIRLESRLIK